VGFYAYAVYPALAWGLFALWSVLKFGESEQPRWLLLGGALVGAASFYRWDIGLYAVGGLAAALFLRQAATVRQQGEVLASAAWAGLKTAALLLAPAVGVSVILYGWVSLNSGLGFVWDQVLVFPATRLREVRWLAYPALIPGRLPALADFRNFYSWPMDWLRFYLPLAVYGFAIVYYSAMIAARRLQFSVPHFGAVAAGGVGLLAFAQALSRYDYIHALPTGLFAFLVIVALASQVRSAPGGRILGVVLLILLPGAFAVYCTAPLDSLFRTLNHFPPWNCYSRLARASCAALSENQQQAVETVWRYTRAADPIYVGNTRHDDIFVSDVGFYFLAGRPSATRYGELHPGVANTLPVQLEMIQELESRQVPILVLMDIPKSNEPNASAQSSGVHDLDRYIRVNYAVVAQYGEYTVWQRRVK
jgi:hypothetical protein